MPQRWSNFAGYTLSREAVKRFVEIGLKTEDQSKCKTIADTGAEDAEMGKCLMNSKVVAGDSRDAQGLPRYFPLNPGGIISGHNPDWYWQYIWFNHKNVRVKFR